MRRIVLVVLAGLGLALGGLKASGFRLGGDPPPREVTQLHMRLAVKAKRRSLPLQTVTGLVGRLPDDTTVVVAHVVVHLALEIPEVQQPELARRCEG